MRCRCGLGCNCTNSSGIPRRAGCSRRGERKRAENRKYKMSDRRKAVVLLSGGMDSCVVVAIARETHNLALLHVSYGQRTEQRERQAFDAIADFYGVTERLAVHFEHF